MSTSQAHSSRLIYFMALTCALVVGNVYYAQPLLGHIAREFALTEKQVSWVPLFNQIGYAVGIIFLVPLGDKVRKPGLILKSMLCAGLCALGLAFAPQFWLVEVLAFGVGFFNVTPSVLIPLAADISKPNEKGKTVGIILSGILIGALISRTLAGFVGHHFGWRAVFIFSGMISLSLGVINYKLLPNFEPTFKGSYTSLLKSLVSLVRELPVLREAALIGALLFASFNAFWTTLTFLLEGAPFYFSSQVVGLFGALGAIGALGAPFVGKTADKKGARFTLRIGIFIALLAFAILGLSTQHLVGLVIGVLLLDMGIQVSHVSNQSRIYEFKPEARSRLNTVYIFSYFLGGGLGSLAGGLLWTWKGWPAVCIGGLIAVLCTLVPGPLSGRKASR